MNNQLTQTNIAKKSRKPHKRSVFPENPSGNSVISALYDECRRRGSDVKDMAAELGVTYGYINQLRTGIRKTEQITQKTAEAMARYLSIPTISVKLAAGIIKISDFEYQVDTEEAAIERVIVKISTDADYFKMPIDLSTLSFSAKKIIVVNYVENSAHDVLGLNTLSVIAQRMQLAAKIHANLALENHGLDNIDYHLHNFFRNEISH